MRKRFGELTVGGVEYINVNFKPSIQLWEFCCQKPVGGQLKRKRIVNLFSNHDDWQNVL